MVSVLINVATTPYVLFLMERVRMSVNGCWTMKWVTWRLAVMKKQLRSITGILFLW